MPLRRRRFVRATATVCVAALAGCFGSGRDTDTAAPADTDDATTTATGTTADTTTATARETTEATGTPTVTRTQTPTATQTATTTRSTTATTQATGGGGGSSGGGTTSEGTDGSTPRSGSATETDATGNATANGTATPATGTATNATATGTGATTTGGVAVEIAVGPGGKLVFSPEATEVGVGDTVRWIARSTGHNVSGKPDANGTVSLPRGAEPFASYSGDNHYTGLMDAGATYEHTFQTAGEYTYICVPHVLQGMVGRISVTE